MNKNWSNTALVAYSLLPKIIKELDKGVKNRVNASFQSRHLKMGISTQKLIDEILELNDEKRKIVNLHYIVSKALNAMKDDLRNVLTRRIIERQTFQSISNESGVSIRTLFRKVSAAEDIFEQNLRRAGFTDEWFEREYGQDKYISPIHDRVVNDAYFIAKNL